LTAEIVDKVHVYHGDIIDDELTDAVDAIVNPTNERLWADVSGVCGTVFRAAGHDALEKACSAITDQIDDHSIPNGQTAITDAFNIDVEHILHTVAPCSNEQNSEQLRSCYISILELCAIRGVSCVAIPCIGTGDGNFGLATACSIALRTVRQWLCYAQTIRYRDFVKQWKNREWHRVDGDDEKQQYIYIGDEESVADRLRAIVFCCFDEENYAIYKQSIRAVFPEADAQHSFEWTHNKHTMDHKRELNQMRMQLQSLQRENDENREVELSGIEDTLSNLKKHCERFEREYNEERLGSIDEASSHRMIEMQKRVACLKANLMDVSEIAAVFLQSVEKAQDTLSKSIVPDPKHYAQWNVDEIVIWVMSLSDGLFMDYVDKLRAGLIKSGITSGETLPMLTRSDLSVPPFDIHNFNVKRELIEHFKSLKKDVSEDDVTSV